MEQASPGNPPAVTFAAPDGVHSFEQAPPASYTASSPGNPPAVLPRSGFLPILISSVQSGGEETDSKETEFGYQWVSIRFDFDFISVRKHVESTSNKMLQPGIDDAHKLLDEMLQFLIPFCFDSKL
ncbi:hypothetical protein LXL04_036763 [Taraxacum kok-saghyz]